MRQSEKVATIGSALLRKHKSTLSKEECEPLKPPEGAYLEFQVDAQILQQHDLESVLFMVLWDA